MTENWVMEIEQVFQFSEGRTVFVGSIKGNVAFIRSCECVLVCKGQKTKLRIEGEMIPERSLRKGLRAVSSAEQLSIDRVTTAGCRLVCTETAPP